MRRHRRSPFQVHEVVPEREDLTRSLAGVRIVRVKTTPDRMLLFRKLVAANARLLFAAHDLCESQAREHGAIFEALRGRQFERAKVFPPGLFALTPMPIEQVGQQSFGGLLLA